MAVGDRVKVGDGSTWTDEVTVMVYDPIWETDGKLRVDNFGAATLKRLGGVKGGSTGVIHGQPVRVHRITLAGEQPTPTIGGIDLISVFPVMFDSYQKVGWVPSHHIRVMSGGTGLDMKQPS